MHLSQVSDRSLAQSQVAGTEKMNHQCAAGARRLGVRYVVVNNWVFVGALLDLLAKGPTEAVRQHQRRHYLQFGPGTRKPRSPVE